MKKFYLGALILTLISCGAKTDRTVLFNGDDLSGWVAVTDTTGGVCGDDVFTVKDGMISVKGAPFGYLRTDKKYTDYKLHVEWRWVGEGTNSGIFQRVQDGDGVWPAAVECQLHAGDAGDFVCLNGFKIEGVEFAPGAMFAVKKRTSPAGTIEKQMGEWNTAEIICQGTNIKVYINGSFENECNASASSGYIALQSEGGPLEFRNIYIE